MIGCDTSSAHNVLVTVEGGGVTGKVLRGFLLQRVSWGRIASTTSAGQRAGARGRGFLCLMFDLDCPDGFRWKECHPCSD